MPSRKRTSIVAPLARGVPSQMMACRLTCRLSPWQKKNAAPLTTTPREDLPGGDRPVPGAKDGIHCGDKGVRAPSQILRRAALACAVAGECAGCAVLRPRHAAMPLLLLASFALTILCAIHVVRSGRPLYWIWLLLIGSYLAVGVYVFVAVLPDLRNDPRSRKATRRVLETIDPERRRRAIRERLELADTTDNRRALAEECLRLGDYR